ncbi:hypothetical protein GCM10022600_28390 [Qipengyuania pelagi]|uniref:hypothetical protein n=1 Tax=Qipengyuania pelagi TaxID=994320 RepID=UPI002FE9751F
MKRAGLSKSRITSFEQCPRKLWLSVHRPELGAQDDDAEARFAAGNEVGEIACSLHPEGVMVEANAGLSAAVAETERLIASGHPGPIFEATFEHEGVLVRVDVLERAGEGWHAAEVKSSTGVKDYHRGDLATQIWVMRRAGLPLESAAIRHVDRSFELARPGDYAGLFVDVDLSRQLDAMVSGRPEVVSRARDMLVATAALSRQQRPDQRPLLIRYTDPLAQRCLQKAALNQALSLRSSFVHEA